MSLPHGTRLGHTKSLPPCVPMTPPSLAGVSRRANYGEPSPAD